MCYLTFSGDLISVERGPCFVFVICRNINGSARCDLFWAHDHVWGVTCMQRIKWVCRSLTHCSLGDLSEIFDRWLIVINICGISCKIALGWMSLDRTNDKSAMVQVMACRQATGHYLTQCWPISLSPYNVRYQATMGWYTINTTSC